MGDFSIELQDLNLDLDINLDAETITIPKIPIMSPTVLGGAKLGSNLTITEDGVLSAGVQVNGALTNEEIEQIIGG